MILGAKILEHRKKIQASAQQLATACGVSRSHITLIETGRRLPSQKIIPEIAKALGVKTEDVLNWYLEDMRAEMSKKILP